jgi:hypothetical protein
MSPFKIETGISNEERREKKIHKIAKIMEDYAFYEEVMGGAEVMEYAEQIMQEIEK